MDLLGKRNRERLQSGPFSPHIVLVQDLVRAKLEQGFNVWTVRQNVRVVADFGEWLETEAIMLSSIGEHTPTDFVRGQPGGVHGGLTLVRGIIGQLRDIGVCPNPVPGKPDERWVEDFCIFLQRERGLYPSTIRRYRYFIKMFLEERFPDGPVEVSTLTAEDAIEFVLGHAKKWGSKTNAYMVSALRSFFRFLRMLGLVDRDMAGAVPGVAAWRLQDVPKGLEIEEVEKLLRQCPRNTPVGRRDYAILQLLARLGLRGGEVVNLALDDIDWDAGELLICGKGRRLHRLPMPQEVGEAIVDYLRNGRPRQATTRRLFVRARPPYKELASTVVISCLMRRRLRRAGLKPPRTGAHVLRHSLATRMLNQGASLREIGLLLRHQRVDTTAIYAKVAQPSLRELAQPWPEVDCE